MLLFFLNIVRGVNYRQHHVHIGTLRYILQITSVVETGNTSYVSGFNVYAALYQEFDREKSGSDVKYSMVSGLIPSPRPLQEMELNIG
jgi:hypothetical protein